MSRSRPFDRLADIVERESRGEASPRDRRRLEADPDAWAAALRREIDRVTDDLDRRARELQAETAVGLEGDELAQRRVEHAEWERRARSFRSRLCDRLGEVDRRRAKQLHQQLRLAADAVYNGAVEGAIVNGDLEELRLLLEQLDDLDPLPQAAEAV